MITELRFELNGVDQTISLDGKCSIGEFLRLLRARYCNDSSCISSIRFDGDEVTERREAVLAALPVSNLGQIEIFTAHPRELAEETLQGLIEFTNHLIRMSQDIGRMFEEGSHPAAELSKLFDGIHTFTDALAGTKQILRVQCFNDLGTLRILEMDMLSIMQDLLQSYRTLLETPVGLHRDYLVDLLTKHLPTNLRDWRDKGLPDLVRSRDS